ncbi:MAG: hypothetical protein MJD61_14065, partial [Proteobacteria bacterium]|nr:hypothetical protein [Pseudomonadota bacterium]
PLPEPPKVTRLRKKRTARKKPPKLPPVVEALRRARDYQRRIATGEARDRADLARQLGFSRARATQVLYLMELAPEIPEQRFFGFEELTVLGHAVQMATTERALLDALDRPRYAGGIGEVSRIAARAARKVSWERLTDLSRKWGSSALVQRLGYFMDLHQVDVPDDVRASLLELVRPHSKIQLGSRRKWGTSGKLVRPWNVVENVPRDVLISKEEKPRRRVVFVKKEQSK